MHDWKHSDNGSSKPFGESPHRRRLFGANAKESPKDRARREQTLAGSPKKPVTLPGFQNSFMPTSPIVSKRSRAKGKGKDSTAENKDETMDQTPRLAKNSRPPSLQSSPVWHQGDIQETAMNIGSEIKLDGNEFGFDNMDEVADVEMDGSFVLKSPSSEDLEEIEVPSWKEEVCVVYIVTCFSH
jgi:hypothetical protein